MYVVVSYTRAHGRVIRPGLSLVDAYRLVARLGHGAVFRTDGLSAYSRPVYPVVPHRPVRTAAAAGHCSGEHAAPPLRRAAVRHEGSLV